jgi:hypothetical protein
MVVPLIARNTLGAGERLVVVSEDEASSTASARRCGRGCR